MYTETLEKCWTSDPFWRVQEQFGAVGLPGPCNLLPPLKPLTSNIDYAGCSLKIDGTFACNEPPPVQLHTSRATSRAASRAASHAASHGSRAASHEYKGCALGIDGNFTCDEPSSTHAPQFSVSAPWAAAL